MRSVALALLVACGDNANVTEPCFVMTRSLAIDHHRCTFGHPLVSADVFAIEGATCPGPNGGLASCDMTFGVECEPDDLHCTMNPKIDFATDPTFSADTEFLDGIAGLAIIDDPSGAECTFIPCARL